MREIERELLPLAIALSANGERLALASLNRLEVLDWPAGTLLEQIEVSDLHALPPLRQAAPVFSEFPGNDQGGVAARI